jgi:hypothetical protein
MAPYVWINDLPTWSRRDLIREVCVTQVELYVETAREMHKRGFIEESHQVLGWAVEKIGHWAKLDAQIAPPLDKEQA